MSFMLTTPQFIDGSKDVTRRAGWIFATNGMRIMGVEKSQGLGKGGKIRKLGEIELLDVRRERLDLMLTDFDYGMREVRREGFPHMLPLQFVTFFCGSHKGCKPETIITRIEFKRL